MEERKDSTQVTSDGDLTQPASDTDSLRVEIGDDVKSPLTPNQIDPHGKCRYWLRDHLCEDANCAMDALDIHHALIASIKTDREQHERIARLADPRTIAAVWNSLVTDTFPNSSTVSAELSRNGNKYSDVFGVRWRKLENCSFSNAIPTNVRGHFLNDAHALLYLPQPARSVAWLRMYIKADSNTSLSMHSIGCLYEYSFSRSRDTHSLLTRDELRDVIFQTYRNTSEVQVTKDYSVIKGISTTKMIPVGRILAQRTHKQYKKLSRSGLIPPPPLPTNKFTAQLLSSPLLPNRPLRWNPSEPGPMIDRLRRRAEHPRQPLGDEEPGFPGVSMKTEQRREKIVGEQWDKLVRSSLVEGPRRMTQELMNEAIAEAVLERASGSREVVGAEGKGEGGKEEKDLFAETILRLQREAERELRGKRKK